MLSPTIAMKYVPIWAPLISPTLSQCGAIRMNATLAATASTAAAARAAASLDTAHHLASEDPGRPREQHDQDQRERDREPNAVEVEVQMRVVRRDEVQDDADHEPADDRADRALETADDRGRERVDEDRPHHVRIEWRRGRGREKPRHGADRGREPPAEPEHPADADPDEPARDRVQSRGPEREPELRVPEEQPEQRHEDERHGEDPSVLPRDGDAAEVPGARRERSARRERTHLGLPDPVREAAEQDEEPDREDHAVDRRPALDGAHDDPLQRDAADERDHQRQP